MNLDVVLQAVYDCGAEDVVALRDEWDCGWQVRIDDAMEPLAADLTEATTWLHSQALQRYPAFASCTSQGWPPKRTHASSDARSPI
jgi:hypothetical protein